MTSRQCYEAILIELNKENAPNILLEDFNYLFNKAINLYINKRYNIYDINLQTTDDLRVLKATALLKPEKCQEYGALSDIGRMMGATYEVNMPTDYLHILNCICIYDVRKTFKCYNKGDVWRRAATRLTADVYSQILDNFWLRPTYRRPYYYIHNVNEYNKDLLLSEPVIPTNKYRRPENLPENVTESTTVNNTTQTSKTVTYSFITNATDYLKDGRYKKKIIYYEYRQIPGEGSTLILPTEDEMALTYDPNWNLLDDTKKIVESCTSQAVKIPTTAQATNYQKYTITMKDIMMYQGYIGTDAVLAYSDEVNTSDELNNLGEDYSSNKIAVGEGVPTGVEIYNASGDKISNIERGQSIRYGNVSNVRMEIRYGTDDSLFELKKVYIDYIKAPQNIRLTLEQLDLTEDTSQMLEFPDYVCQEIINELVHIVMENIADLRLQTHPVVSLSIANPAQGLTEPVAQLG